LVIKLFGLERNERLEIVASNIDLFYPCFLELLIVVEKEIEFWRQFVRFVELSNLKHVQAVFLSPVFCKLIKHPEKHAHWKQRLLELVVPAILVGLDSNELFLLVKYDIKTLGWHQAHESVKELNPHSLGWLVKVN